MPAMLEVANFVFERVPKVVPGPGCEINRRRDGSIPLMPSVEPEKMCALEAAPAVSMFRDDRHADQVPPMLYVGHIHVPEDERGVIRHPEGHVTLETGVYLVRRTEF